MRFGIDRRRTVLLAALVAALAFAGPAWALPNLQITFTPSRACPGDKVYLNASIGNVGMAAQKVVLVATVTAGGNTYGPYTIERRVRRNQILREKEAVHLPHDAPAGTAVLTVIARLGGSTVSDSAEIDICKGKTKRPADPAKLAARIRGAFRDLRH